MKRHRIFTAIMATVLVFGFGTGTFQGSVSVNAAPVPLEADPTPGAASNGSFDYGQIPAYTGTASVAVNNNRTFFTDAERGQGEPAQSIIVQWMRSEDAEWHMPAWGADLRQYAISLIIIAVVHYDHLVFSILIPLPQIGHIGHIPGCFRIQQIAARFPAS